MKLKLERDLKVAVQINGKSFINSLEGLFYQKIGEEEALFLIRSEDGNKEIKIRISLDKSNKGILHDIEDIKPLEDSSTN